MIVGEPGKVLRLAMADDRSYRDLVVPWDDLRAEERLMWNRAAERLQQLTRGINAAEALFTWIRTEFPRALVEAPSHLRRELSEAGRALWTHPEPPPAPATYHHCSRCDTVHENRAESCPIGVASVIFAPPARPPATGEIRAIVAEEIAKAHDAALGRELAALLAPHAGETGKSEGAVDVLKRVLEENAALKRDLDARKHTRLLDLRSLLEVTGSRWKVNDDGTLVPPPKGESFAWHCVTCGAEVLVVPQGDELVLPPGWVSGAPDVGGMQRVFCSPRCREIAEGRPS